MQRLRFWLGSKYLLTRIAWCHIENLGKWQERFIQLHFKEGARSRETR